jgi:hypothetical protein
MIYHIIILLKNLKILLYSIKLFKNNNLNINNLFIAISFKHQFNYFNHLSFVIVIYL